MRFLAHRTVQVFLLLGIYLLCASYLPSVAHHFLYTISVFIKDCLMWVIPITMLFFIASTLKFFGNRAPFFIIAIVLFEALSNFSSIWYAFGCGNMAAHFLPDMHTSVFKVDFGPLWRLPFVKPSWWSATQGVFLGVLLGCTSGILKNEKLASWIDRGKGVMEFVLTKCFARLIPLFILGFVAQLYETRLLSYMAAHYAPLVGFLFVCLVFYIGMLIFIGADGSASRFVQNAKALMPAGGIALTTGCSLSTMPWTIAGAMKTLRKPDLAKVVIPTTTNIQQIGDCITNTFLCFLIYRQFYGHSPDFFVWFQFSIVFTLARFATAAVLGGAMFLMLPIYEKYLLFQPEMLALIVAFNVVLDPLVTSANVIANGALCRIFESLWLRLPRSFWEGSKKLPSQNV